MTILISKLSVVLTPTVEVQKDTTKAFLKEERNLLLNTLRRKYLILKELHLKDMENLNQLQIVHVKGF